MPHSDQSDEKPSTTTTTATNTSSQTKMAAQVNGETPSSAFLHHLTSYPIVHDSITTFKSNPYGRKSIDLTSQGYERLGKPFVPYFHTPYQYISPYLQKADSFGDSTLSTIDTRFPQIKKPTEELYSEGKSIVFFPIKKSTEGKEYVLSKYQSEIKKVGDEGYVGQGKALLATGLGITGDLINYASAFLSKKKEQAEVAIKDAAPEKTTN
ncbi:hypothetical protein B7463_g7525, partial [Scytalidium lignicola]